jgi:hypothetical protein
MIKICLRNAIELKSPRTYMGEDSYMKYGFIYGKDCDIFLRDLLFFLSACPSDYSGILSRVLPKNKNKKE